MSTQRRVIVVATGKVGATGATGGATAPEVTLSAYEANPSTYDDAATLYVVVVD